MPQSITRIPANIDSRLLRAATEGTLWDLGKGVLYDLCAKYPKHDADEEILAKIWLIGRSYAAAIERRKNSKQDAEQFYLKTVAPEIRNSDIDTWLSDIAGERKPTPENYSRIVAVHKRLTDLFFDISGMGKRSLASKYLHFHFPHLFYIYDSRASSAVAKVTVGIGRELPVLAKYDDVYARFFLRCMVFVDQIAVAYQVELTPRQLDTYLLGLMET